MNSEDRRLYSIVGPRGDWVKRAACASDVDPNWFVPHDAESNTQKAREVCYGKGDQPECPVRNECLKYALDEDIRDGIYGGLSPVQRRRLGRPANPANKKRVECLELGHTITTNAWGTRCFECRRVREEAYAPIRAARRAGKPVEPPGTGKACGICRHLKIRCSHMKGETA